MIRTLICGACGKMGANLFELLNEETNIQAVCGLDWLTKKLPVPLYHDFNSVEEEVDVIIDFSSAVDLKDRLEYAKQKNIPIVLATTGYSESDLVMIDEYSKLIPIFKTANFSIGVNLLVKLAREAAEFLGEKFDVEIIERHHNLKKDAPSGTALALAESVNEAFEQKKPYVEGRSGIVGARKNEIGIHAVRGGTIVGEHEVMFAGEDEIISLSHSARSKRVFAVGAIRAAKYIVGKPAGMYDMQKLLADEL